MTQTKPSEATPLRTWRLRRGLLGRELAQMLDIHESMLSKVERNLQPPGLALALRIQEITNGEVSVETWARPAS